MRRIGLLQALALFSLIEPCSGQATRVPDLMITSPLNGAVVQADEVSVDLSWFPCISVLWGGGHGMQLD